MAATNAALPSTTTLTFSDCSENHAGMQKIGATLPVGGGITVEALEALAAKIPGAELHRLDYRLDHPAAAVLVLRDGLRVLGIDPEALAAEHAALPKDTTFLSRFGVRNKRARWNLCFADFHQSADIPSGKGTIFAFSELPQTNALKEQLTQLLGPEIMRGIDTAEANYYYDMRKCGIGYHGDAERRKVVGVRQGESMPLCYRWYKRSQPDAERLFVFQLNAGDLYVMSEKAVGTDWRKSSIWTLRHAAGCEKYTGPLPAQQAPGSL